jgi:hypothetical protein
MPVNDMVGIVRFALVKSEDRGGARRLGIDNPRAVVIEDASGAVPPAGRAGHRDGGLST